MRTQPQPLVWGRDGGLFPTSGLISPSGPRLYNDGFRGPQKVQKFPDDHAAGVEETHSPQGKELGKQPQGHGELGPRGSGDCSAEARRGAAEPSTQEAAWVNPRPSHTASRLPRGLHISRAAEKGL